MAASPPTYDLVCKHQRHLLRSTALVEFVNRKQVLHCCRPLPVAVDLLIRSASLILGTAVQTSERCLPRRCVQLSSPTRQSVVATPKSWPNLLLSGQYCTVRRLSISPHTLDSILVENLERNVIYWQILRVPVKENVIHCNAQLVRRWRYGSEYPKHTLNLIM